jgi:hypothetical protein
MNEFEKIALTAPLAFGGGYLTRLLLDKRGERRALVRVIADKYISGVSTAARSDESHFRLGVLQRSGAALLTKREFASMVEIVVGHGCPDPTKNHELCIDIPLLDIIRAANAENVDIGSATDYYKWLLSKFGSRLPPTNGPK